MSLSAQQNQFYDDNGYILVPGLFSPAEAAELRQAAHDLAARMQKIRSIDAPVQVSATATSVSSGSFGFSFFQIQIAISSLVGFSRPGIWFR